jgi:hypothetical protein
VPSLDPGARLAVEPDPSWQVASAGPGRSSLLLRHPGFGWLGFSFGANEAAEIAAALFLGANT